MRKMFLVTYLTRNERFLRFLLNMYIYFCGILLVTITENNLKKIIMNLNSATKCIVCC